MELFFKKIKKRNAGYTIIETMIAVSVFLIVVTIGMDALLNTGVIHQKSQDMRSIMDNLSFVMEDMSKSLRTGSDYHCIDDGNLTLTSPHSCANGDGISFKSVDGDRLIYVLNSDIQRSTAGGTYVPLTSPEITVDLLSSFTVAGAELADTNQPLITIRLVGKITYKNVNTPFSLQTSVSQRKIDVP